MQSEGITKCPSGRSLPSADYRDVTKPLRRMFRQLGSGCLTAGVMSLKGEGAGLGEVARAIEVDPQELAQEVAQVGFREGHIGFKVSQGSS